MCISLWVSSASRQASAGSLFCSTKYALGGEEAVLVTLELGWVWEGLLDLRGAWREALVE